MYKINGSVRIWLAWSGCCASRARLRKAVWKTHSWECSASISACSSRGSGGSSNLQRLATASENASKAICATYYWDICHRCTVCMLTVRAPNTYFADMGVATIEGKLFWGGRENWESDCFWKSDTWAVSLTYWRFTVHSDSVMWVTAISLGSVH